MNTNPTLRLLSLTQSDDWTRYLSRLPKDQQDVYFTPDLHRLYEKKGDGKAYCCVFEYAGSIALYPFLSNRINDLGYALDNDYYDIQGAYGYNGVATNTNDATFFREFQTAWLNWISDNRVIAEFIRFNPVLKNEAFCPWTEPIDVLDNVLIPLSDYKEIWAHSYDSGVRNAIRKANKYSLAFSLQMGDQINDSDYAQFINLYQDTMQRRDAGDFYYFDQEYFSNLRMFLKDFILLSTVHFEGEIISADLYLHNHLNAYGFLSGTRRDFFKMSPNTYLRDKTIQALVDLGFQNYSIGGGLQRNDSIYRYKKSFSISTESLFYIGKIVHDADIYNNIVSQWRQRVGEETKNFEHLLLKYRYGLNDAVAQ